MLISAASQAQAQPPFQPVGGVAIDPQETQQLDDLFTQARAAAAAIAPGPDAGAQRRAVDNELHAEVADFVGGHTNSAWNPGALLWLARGAQVRSAYCQAIDRYQQVWTASEPENCTMSAFCGVPTPT